MRFRDSIRARLIIGATLVLIAFVAGAGLAVQRAHADSVRAARFAQLRSTVYLLLAGAEVDAAGALVMPESFPEPRLSLPGSGLENCTWVTEEGSDAVVITMAEPGTDLGGLEVAGLGAAFEGNGRQGFVNVISSTKDGQHTNGIYGFLSMFVNLVKAEQPTHLAVAFDTSRQSFRTRVYEEYKANRSESPSEFKGQIPLYTAFTIDSLSLPRQGDNALGVPGTQHWVNDLPNDANKKYVADFRAKHKAYPSFYGAQMTAMDNATRNAGEMIRKQTLVYNRTRQAMITKELIEIISGAEAV